MIPSTPYSLTIILIDTKIYPEIVLILQFFWFTPHNTKKNITNDMKYYRNDLYTLETGWKDLERIYGIKPGTYSLWVREVMTSYKRGGFWFKIFTNDIKNNIFYIE